mmetsp:Transcript_25767/g.72171  ORF Transcript_25767/g.72171 Transcript_25767/m.72171 type:complete len:205 (-) Transcript_25767:544-1158(-)
MKGVRADRILVYDRYAAEREAVKDAPTCARVARRLQAELRPGVQAQKPRLLPPRPVCYTKFGLAVFGRTAHFDHLSPKPRKRRKARLTGAARKGERDGAGLYTHSREVVLNRVSAVKVYRSWVGNSLYPRSGATHFKSIHGGHAEAGRLGAGRRVLSKKSRDGTCYSEYVPQSVDCVERSVWLCFEPLDRRAQLSGDRSGPPTT